jgi:MFS family permease
MSESATLGYSPWYRSLNRTQWKALIASNLGWTFDGFEVFALILTIGAALHQLLDPSEYKFIPFYAGAVIAITVFGWGAGGLLGGILADYIGRKRSMTLTILGAEPSSKPSRWGQLPACGLTLRAFRRGYACRPKLPALSPLCFS